MASASQKFERPGVRGFLHEPAAGSGVPRAGIVISHGAGSNCDAPLMVAIAAGFADIGWLALRGDLWYRQQRPHGSPANSGARDREGIRQAAVALGELAPGCPIYLAGHSYGGRMSTMLAAEDSAVAEALLLLSYPLHPTGQPAKLRTEHFPNLRTPAMFVHGTRDAFGSIEAMEAALRLIPARTRLITVQGAGHGLPQKLAPQIAEWFSGFVPGQNKD
jgi:predicted alpha/beta-hydrolase family hydrolase